MVNSGNVQTGFITKPLIMRDGKTTGSYWFVPHEYYDPINTTSSTLTLPLLEQAKFSTIYLQTTMSISSF